MHQFTGSYRPAIFALIVFFVIGGLLLLRVDTERGIRDAGNDRPAIGPISSPMARGLLRMEPFHSG